MLVSMIMAAALAYPMFDEATNKALAKAPAEIGRYAERRAECNHWGGEPAWDKARQAQIDKAWRDLGCERLDATERALRKKYVKRQDWVRLLAVE